MATRAVVALSRACGLTAILLTASVTQTNAHEPVNLDNTHPTPGIRLDLVEVAPASQSFESPGYRLTAAGLPAGIAFGVWTRPLGHGFHEIASGFRLNSEGQLVSDPGDGTRPRVLDRMVLRPDPGYPRGAVWEVALVSTDRKITVFAKVVPRPILAQDGPCAVSLLMVSHRGDRFMATGTGFPPGDDVVVESRHADRVSKEPRRVSADGVLPPYVLSFASLGEDRTARYSVKGRNCLVTIDYFWGNPALLGR